MHWQPHEHAHVALSILFGLFISQDPIQNHNPAQNRSIEGRGGGEDWGGDPIEERRQIGNQEIRASVNLYIPRVSHIRVQVISD